MSEPYYSDESVTLVFPEQDDRLAQGVLPLGGESA